MLASQIAISHKENTHMGRLYLFVLGGITFILFNVRLCGIIFAYSHLLAYCLLCGDMSVNPLLLITHCQDENRQLISFWNEYSWRSVLGGICCWSFSVILNVKSKKTQNIVFFSLTNPLRGLVNHTRRVCPEGSRGPEGCRSKKETRRQFWPKSRLKWPKLYVHVHVHALNVALPDP